jgi:hypothetical protein
MWHSHHITDTFENQCHCVVRFWGGRKGIGIVRECLLFWTWILNKMMVPYSEEVKDVPDTSLSHHSASPAPLSLRGADDFSLVEEMWLPVIRDYLLPLSWSTLLLKQKQCLYAWCPECSCRSSSTFSLRAGGKQGRSAPSSVRTVSIRLVQDSDALLGTFMVTNVLWSILIHLLSLKKGS